MNPEVYFAVPGDIQALTGGYGYDRRLIGELRRLGMTVHLLSLSATFPLPDRAALEQAEAAFAALPDASVVIADGLAFGAMDAVAQRHGRRLQIVALCHHPLALESGLSDAEAAERRLSEQRALAAAAAVVVTSEATATLLVEQFGISREQITVAAPGTERKHFAPCQGDPPVLLCVATLTPRKAHDVLIQAMARLSHLPWQLRLVGGDHFDPEWARYLRQLAASCGLAQRIHFVGELAGLDDEYGNADLFVLPSRFEGYGMAFAEALSFGLPVVAARAGAVPDLVPESAGLLVTPGDTDALTQALAALLPDRALRRRLQLGARQAARQLPTWEQCADTVASLLNRLTSPPRADSRPEGFSSAWLDLRESADQAARDNGLVARALVWLDHHADGAPRIVDLGAGTGSTLRAFVRQRNTSCLWRLVDHDAGLLDEARRRHGHLPGFECSLAELGNVAALPLGDAKLVTASALFDLVSRPLVEELAARVCKLRAGFYAALNYNGLTQWNPPHAMDAAVLAAFNRDQTRDKGTGPALGPDAADCLGLVFTALGYVVIKADSPWVLGPPQQALVTALIRGIAAAVADGYGLDADALQEWEAFRLSMAATGSCHVGHTDILALPDNSIGP